MPNPFDSSTRISYVVPDGINASRVQLGIYDPMGRLVRTLIDSSLPGGTYGVIWDGSNGSGEAVAEGVYFHRLQVNGETLTRRAILVR